MTITKNDIKNLKSLRAKKGRLQHRLFLAEGVRLLEESIRHKKAPNAVYFAPDALSERGERLVAKFKKNNVPIHQIALKALNSISDTKASQGIIGTFSTDNQPTVESLLRNKRMILWCENISDPGNIGTLLRSALAFSSSGILLSGSSADVFNPKVVRATAGALFGLSVCQTTTSDILTALKKTMTRLVAADIRGDSWYKNLPTLMKIPNLILAVGSEADGLSAEIINRADYICAVPIANKSESLNAAVAGAIMMNDLYQGVRKK